MKIESIYYNATLNQFVIVTMTDKGLTSDYGYIKAVSSNLNNTRDFLAQEDVILVGYL